MRKDKSYWVAMLMAVICLGIAALFFGKIAYQELQYKEGDDVYEHIADIVADDSDPSEENDIQEKEGVAEEEALDIGIDITDLQAENPNVKAWLYCPDIVINYPVCQGEDNSYYLKHLVDGTYNANGCLFIDCKNADDFSDDNTIIYGHHMKSGKMFASLIKYADQAYYEEHPEMYLVIGNKTYLVEIFSGYVTTVDSSAYTINCGSRKEFAEWLRAVSNRSDFNPNAMEISLDDRIVTLSTCAYNFHNARYVIHGRIREI